MRISGCDMGSVEHLEEKGRESVVAILRFLCGSPHPCQLRTASFWLRWQPLSCVLTPYQVLWGPISRVAFVITLSNHTSLLRVVLLLLEGEWGEAEGQDFILGAGARFRPSRDLWMVVIRESLRESSVCRVGQVLPLQGVYRFESPWHSRLWVTSYHCSHLVVCLVYCWWIQGVGYGYDHDYIIIMIIVFTYLWHWHGSTFCLFMLVLVCRCKHST
jgi:hypothetical protein